MEKTVDLWFDGGGGCIGQVRCLIELNRILIMKRWQRNPYLLPADILRRLEAALGWTEGPIKVSNWEEILLFDSALLLPNFLAKLEGGGFGIELLLNPNSNFD
ncbi:MAG: hypothetical protein ACE361_05405 [Aureliella sp.]